MATLPTTPPNVGAITVVPNRATNTQAELSNNTDTMLGDLIDLQTEQNALSTWEATTANQVYNNAVEASDSAVAASYSADSAALSGNFVGAWSSQSGAANKPYSVEHNNTAWLLLNNLVDVALSEPGVSADWFDANSVSNQALLLASATNKRQWPTIANGNDDEHDIDFSAGKIPDSEGVIGIVSPAMTKRLDASWAPGTNTGGLFSGVIAIQTTYHCFVIVKASDGTVDAGFDTDPDCANIPAGYVAYRRIGSIFTDADSNIVPFTQRGDDFELLSHYGIGNTSFSTSNQVHSPQLSLDIHGGGLLTSWYVFGVNIPGSITFARLSVSGSDQTPSASPSYDAVLTSNSSIQGFSKRINQGSGDKLNFIADMTGTGPVVVACTLAGWTDSRL